MITEYNFLDSEPSAYLGLNILVTLITFTWLLFIYRTSRYMFLKPSMALVVYTHILFQWPLALYSSYYEATAREPYILFLIVHGFNLYLLALTQIIGRNICKDLWFKIHTSFNKDVPNSALKFIGICVIILTSMYLLYVPFSSTGLWAVFLAPDQSTAMREDSLKTLENPIPRYAFSLMATAVAPLLAVLVAWRTNLALRRGQNFTLLMAVIVIFMLLIAVSLTGERGRPVIIILTITYCFFLRRSLFLKPSSIILIVLLALVPAAVITLLREDMAITWSNFWLYIGLTSQRAFLVPFDAGTWHVDYAETYGFWGVAGIERLALLLDVPPIRIDNVVGLHFIKDSFSTIAAGAGFIFSQYACFGLISIPVAIVQSLLLDISLNVYQRLPDYLLTPFISAVTVLTLNFIQGSYLTAWASSGLGLLLLFGLLLSNGSFSATKRH